MFKKPSKIILAPHVNVSIGLASMTCKLLENVWECVGNETGRESAESGVRDLWHTTTQGSIIQPCERQKEMERGIRGK